MHITGYTQRGHGLISVDHLEKVGYAHEVKASVSVLLVSIGEDVFRQRYTLQELPHAFIALQKPAVRYGAVYLRMPVIKVYVVTVGLCTSKVE